MTSPKSWNKAGSIVAYVCSVGLKWLTGGPSLQPVNSRYLDSMRSMQTTTQTNCVSHGQRWTHELYSNGVRREKVGRGRVTLTTSPSPWQLQLTYMPIAKAFWESTGFILPLALHSCAVALVTLTLPGPSNIYSLSTHSRTNIKDLLHVDANTDGRSFVTKVRSPFLPPWFSRSTPRWSIRLDPVDPNQLLKECSWSQKTARKCKSIWGLVLV